MPVARAKSLAACIACNEELARVGPANARKLAIGVALSLLLHGLLVAAYWNRRLPADRAVLDASPSLEVRLLRSSQSPPPADTPPPQHLTQARTRSLNSWSAAKQLAAPGSAIRSLETAGPTAASQVVTEKPLDLDMRAGVKAAVALVDREKRDTPVGQLQAKPLYAADSETRLGREIAGAARPDCKGRIAGTGLLAPLVVLAMSVDAKDSGCKW